MSIQTTYTTHEHRLEMVEFLPKKFTHVLEIGCGEGTFSAHYASAAERWGVDYNPYSVEKAREKGMRVLYGMYDQVADQLPDNHFDLVICNDVIEHMIDHDAFLEAIKSKLRDGGHIVISLPNIRFIKALIHILIKKDWQYKENGTFDRSHMRFFTYKSLLRTMREHGYTVEKIKGINRAGRPFWALHRSIATWLLPVLTLGYYWDTPYHQWALRARK